LLNHRTLSKSFAAVIAATILSLIGPRVVAAEKMPWSIWLLYLILAFFLLLYSFDILTKGWEQLVLFKRKNFCWHKKVGIIFSAPKLPSSAIPRVWTNVAPECWGALIKEAAKAENKRIRIKLINAKSSFSSFHVIINPYGGNFPEINFNEYTVYNKLLDYIKKGGFFVNVADIPTYFSFNILLGKLVDRTPAVYDVYGRFTRNFRQTPLLEELSLSALMIEREKSIYKLDDRYFANQKKDISLRLSRGVIIENNIDSVTLPIKIDSYEVSPLFFCNYGNGICLISMSWLDRGKYDKNNPNNNCIDYSFDNAELRELIPKLIVKKLFKKI